jgi:hypothetical protein
MKISYLEGVLRSSSPCLRVERTDGSSCCYVIDGDAALAALNGVSPAEEYADCWRGVVMCEADPPSDVADGPHAFWIGGFRFYGDAELLNRLRSLLKPAAP